MPLEQEIARALRNGSHVSFVPNCPAPGCTQIRVYRIGEFGLDRAVETVDDVAELAKALGEINNKGVWR